MPVRAHLADILLVHLEAAHMLFQRLHEARLELRRSAGLLLLLRTLNRSSVESCCHVAFRPACGVLVSPITGGET